MGDLRPDCKKGGGGLESFECVPLLRNKILLNKDLCSVVVEVLLSGKGVMRGRKLQDPKLTVKTSGSKLGAVLEEGRACV